MDWDVFISHAWEDKEAFARPLAKALEEKGLRVWYDEFTLTLGDSLRRSIDRGLAQSRYGVVILSPNFFAKEWPQKELDGLVAREDGSRKVILPVWHNVTWEDVRRFSPMLAGKLAVSTAKGLDVIVEEILRALGVDDKPKATREEHRPGPRSVTRRILAKPRRPVNWERVGAIAGIIAVVIALSARLVPNAGDFLSGWLSETPVAAVTPKPPTDTPTVTPTNSSTHTPVISTATPTHTRTKIPTPTRTSKPTLSIPSLMPTYTPTPTFPLTPATLQRSLTADPVFGTEDIFVVNHSTGGRVNITNHPQRDLEPVWSPDGSKVAFVSDREDGNKEIYIMNADGSKLGRLTVDAGIDESPIWTLDGKRIIFVSDRFEKPDLFMMNPNGSGLVNLTNDPSADIHPRLTSDGQSILFDSDRGGMGPKKYLMSVRGGPAALLSGSVEVFAQFHFPWETGVEQQ